MTFDEIMKQAFSETIDDRLEQMRTVTPKPKFSISFRLWEFKTFRDLRHDRRSEQWTLKRARCVVATMIAAFSLLIGGTAYAAVVVIGRFSFKDKIDYSQMLMEMYPSDKTSIEEYYGLPEEDGWELIDSNIDNLGTLLTYQRGDTRICFTQAIIQTGTMGNISTDRAKVEMLSLYKENDAFVLEFENNETLIYWIYAGYLFDASGNIDKKQVIDLAYSTKIINFQKIF